MFWMDYDLAKHLSFVLISTCLPEKSLPSQYVLSSKPWQQPCQYLRCLLSKYLFPEVLIDCFFKGESSGCGQGQNFTGSCQLDLFQKSNLSKSKKQGTLA
jgi:hypothetical protein